VIRTKKKTKLWIEKGFCYHNNIAYKKTCRVACLTLASSYTWIWSLLHTCHVVPFSLIWQVTSHVLGGYGYG